MTKCSGALNCSVLLGENREQNIQRHSPAYRTVLTPWSELFVNSWEKA